MKSTNLLLIISIVFNYQLSYAQTYTSYLIGSATDVNTTTQAGTLLMGGATDQDDAMRWFLNHVNGGDVLVIRATGADGYNSYLYNLSGATAPNSVETIVIPSIAAANDPYVQTQIHNAEGVFIAGGDQWDYVSKWKNTLVETELNYVANVKKGPIGGTSAGMAIQGNAYFTAQNGTITSAQALANPYNSLVQIGYNDFLSNNYLNNVITDTHFDNPDRRGRHVTFLARLMTDQNIDFKGIACEEYTAVCIEANGIAKVFGTYPSYEDYAYFIQPNCAEPNQPETCISGQPLTWNRNQAALKVYKVAGTTTGENTFNLNTWINGNGGNWLHWFVQNGVFSSINGTAPSVGVAPIITGSTTACTNNNVTYSVQSPITGAIYNWTVSNQGVILNGQGTASIQVSWGTSGAGSVSVTQQ